MVEFSITLLAPAAAVSVDRLRLVAIEAVSRVPEEVAMLDHFVLLKQNRQYDVLCQKGIGGNLSPADSTPNNRKENMKFYLHKRIWETYGRAWYIRCRDCQSRARGNYYPLGYGSAVL